jgi:hypothetical protein
VDACDELPQRLDVARRYSEDSRTESGCPPMAAISLVLGRPPSGRENLGGIHRLVKCTPSKRSRS